ncbi:PHP domain-containing protein [Prevotella sp. 10(H)]|uniref:PHP domain-containing protein n=1 Tax=Prevotella sp. 10(H) TaxID=1158294 RepID=UPI0004A7186B|nr:PHP domain-containing protein [Prevotella sp. 10(H)]
MKKADLHIHTLYSSDGEHTVSDILNMCLNADIGTFSITDHNTVGATTEAAALASEKDILFISGIEIDCNYKGNDLHLLGYGIDWESEDFARLEASVSKLVLDSFSQMVDNLLGLGFNVDAEAVMNKADGKLPSPELIAEVMLSDKKYETPLLKPYMAGGERSDMPYINFYLDYFAQGKSAYVPITYMDYSDALQLVTDNGGIPIVAHPGLNFRGKEEVIPELLDKGARGLEVFNNYHDTQQIHYFASLVTERKALMTCGSDFHGKTKPLIQIGQYKFDDKYKEYLDISVTTIAERK